VPLRYEAAFTSVLRTLARNGDQSRVQGLCQAFTAAPAQASPLQYPRLQSR